MGPRNDLHLGTARRCRPAHRRPPNDLPLPTLLAHSLSARRPAAPGAARAARIRGETPNSKTRALANAGGKAASGRCSKTREPQNWRRGGAESGPPNGTGPAELATRERRGFPGERFRDQLWWMLEQWSVWGAEAGGGGG